MVLLQKCNVRLVLLLTINAMLWCCQLIWLMRPGVSYDNKLTKIGKKGDLVLLMNYQKTNHDLVLLMNNILDKMHDLVLSMDCISPPQ